MSCPVLPPCPLLPCSTLSFQSVFPRHHDSNLSMGSLLRTISKRFHHSPIPLGNADGNNGTGGNGTAGNGGNGGNSNRSGNGNGTAGNGMYPGNADGVGSSVKTKSRMGVDYGPLHPSAVNHGGDVFVLEGKREEIKGILDWDIVILN